ncbi:MAG: DUF2497 domain-containing protein [Geminicoccaceae bacterium]|nr:DUF2497 domain-containing protein [Geminicoccaceae bacterium]
MSKANDEQEPSMEEILSSIRRIIADEQDEEEQPAGGRAVDLRSDEDAKGRAAAGDAEDEDDLELDRPVAEAPGRAYPPVDLHGDADDEEEDDVLDLEHEVAERHGDRREDPEEVRVEDRYGDRAGPVAVEEALDAAFDDDEEEHAEFEAMEMAVANKVEEKLISDTTASASTSAFARLAKAAAGDDQRHIENGDKSVEQFLTDMVRPMLKDWLDQNLNIIVERVVEQEVKKLARRAELM